MQMSRSPEPEPEPKSNGYKIAPSQWRLFLLVLVIGIAGMAYEFLHHKNLQDSAALYVGLPFLLALGFSLTPKAKSAVGATMKGITIALLLTAPIFQEGYICILFASPIFYLVGLLIAWSIDRAEKDRNTKNKLQAAFIATVLAPMSTEGTTDLTSFPRDHEIVVTKTVAASIADVRNALAQTPELGTHKPFFLRIFPYPVAMQGNGLHVGDTRRATFVAYKHIFWNRIEGDEVFTVTEATDRKVKFELTSDNSYVGHYVDWKSSEVELAPVDAQHTQVTWRLSFHRKYDPYWYFGTLQKYAVSLVAEELIDHVATPRT
jgi:hypothetical protein